MSCPLAAAPRQLHSFATRRSSDLVSVTIAPTSATVAARGTQQFTATVQNTGNTAVTWQVNGVTGGNTSVENTSGLEPLTPPASPRPLEVTTESWADTTTSASAQVT